MEDACASELIHKRLLPDVFQCSVMQITSAKLWLGKKRCPLPTVILLYCFELFQLHDKGSS